MPTQDYGQLAVIIPTYKEVPEAVADLVKSVLIQLPRVHVFVVDDSAPKAAIDYFQQVYDCIGDVLGYQNVHVLLRQSTNDTGGGLGGAVRYAMGYARRRGLIAAIVMDGDGQHPTSLLPKMASKLDFYDLVVATRYVEGGSPGDGLSLSRKVVSRLATWFAKLLFPLAIGGCSDPMSGCFGIRFRAIGDFWSEGFKVLAHLMAQYPRLNTDRVEVPYTFEARTAGTSKATIRQGGQYLTGMTQLRFHTFRRPRTVPFADRATDESTAAA